MKIRYDSNLYALGLFLGGDMLMGGKAMSGDVKTGYLFVADISGYTKFMADSELAHAKGILEDLFGAILPAINPPVQISGLLGDAVFAYVIDSSLTSKQFILDMCHKIYAAFQDKKNRIKINTTCICSACKNMEELDLKVFLHHGEFIFQNSQGKDELAGTDVNTLFRLMKNNVVENTGIHAYALITNAAVDKMELKSSFKNDKQHSETYEHIGKIEFVVHDLKKTWQQNYQSEKVYISNDDELLFDEVTTTLPVSADAAFVMYSRPDLRAQLVEADNIDAFNEKGSLIEPGSQFHCHHGNEVIKYEIIDWHPGEYLTFIYRLPFNMSILETTDFKPVVKGAEVKSRFSDIKYKNLVGKFMAMGLKKMLKKKLSATADIISKNLAASSADMLIQNPDLALSDKSSKVELNYKEAINGKL